MQNMLIFPHLNKPLLPDCNTPDKCRIQSTGPTMTTLAYYPPIYDGYGNNLNPDRNTSSTPVTCSTCGKQWSM